MIKGIKGGGYLPQNNFSLNDLDPEEAEALKKEKPGLRMAHELYSEWEDGRKNGTLSPELDEAFRDKLKTELEKYRYRTIDWDDEQIIITKQKDTEFFRYNHFLEKTDNLLDDGGVSIADMIQDYAPRIDEYVAEVVGKAAGSDYFDQIMEYFIQNIDYELWNVIADWDKKDHIVTEKISIGDFVYAEDDTLSYLKELNEQRDDSFDVSDRPIEGDDLAKAFAEYIASSTYREETQKAKGRILVTEILQHYTDEDGNFTGGQIGSHVHPDQLSFDFGDE